MSRSLPTPNKRAEKASPRGRSCAEMGSGRGGEGRLCRAPPPIAGLGQFRVPSSWPVRGQESGCAKWLPTLRLPEEGCSKPRQTALPGCPLPPGSVRLSNRRDAARCPAFGAPPKLSKGDLRLHLTLQRRSPQHHRSLRGTCS